MKVIIKVLICLLLAGCFGPVKQPKINYHGINYVNMPIEEQVYKTNLHLNILPIEYKYPATKIMLKRATGDTFLRRNFWLKSPSLYLQEILMEHFLASKQFSRVSIASYKRQSDMNMTVKVNHLYFDSINNEVSFKINVNLYAKNTDSVILSKVLQVKADIDSNNPKVEHILDGFEFAFNDMCKQIIEEINIHNLQNSSS